MLDLKALLTKILGCCYTESTSGNWRYRKWATGLAEMWYTGSPGSYTVGTARGNLYSGGWITYTYPITLAAEPYFVSTSVTLTTDAYVVLTQTQQAASSNVKIRIVSSGSMAANTNYLIKIYVTGRWK